MLQDTVDNRRVLDACNDPECATAVAAGLDVDSEDTLEALRQVMAARRCAGVFTASFCAHRPRRAVVICARKVLFGANTPWTRVRARPGPDPGFGRWSIWVSGNWRLTFEFKDGNAHVLDYEGYQ